MDKQEKNRKVLVVCITVLAIFGFTGIFIPVVEGQGYAVPLVETADDIMKGVSLGKAIVNAALQELLNKGYVKRIARQKSAGYYACR